MSKDKPPSPRRSLPESSQYFRRLRRPLRLWLLIAYAVPLLLLSSYFHLHFNHTLREGGKLHLTHLAESRRNTMDLFLQERVVNIFNLFHFSGFTLSPTEEDMAAYLKNLRDTSEAFVDVGFLGENGIQTGYAGPFPFLQGQDYSQEGWFQEVMTRSQN